MSCCWIAERRDTLSGVADCRTFGSCVRPNADFLVLDFEICKTFRISRNESLSESNFDPASGQTCRETSGFLFSHECEQMARYACERCGKPICPQHVAYEGMDTLCIRCSQQDPEIAKKKTEPDSDYRNQDGYDPDPYWYSRSYYRTYAWHDNDFTEADESVLVGNDGDDVEWENDMGAS